MGPIAVDVVAQPPPSDLQTQALTASCSEAARPVHCTLAGAEAQTEGVLHAIVTFVDGYARVRVEALVPVTQPDGRSATRIAVREAVFRDSDPVLERFRAAGLIVAGFVADLAPRTPPVRVLPPPRPSVAPSDAAPVIASTASDHDPVEPSSGSMAIVPAATTEQPPSAPQPHGPPVALSIAAIAMSPTDRPRIGASLDGDFSLGASPIFISTHASYAQTVRSDALGLSTLAGTLGVGVGVLVRIPSSPIWVRARARVEVEAMRVAIDQPGTNQRDAVSVRPLGGLGADGELVWPICPVVGVFAGVRVDWTDDEVDVSVGGKPSEVLLPWSGTVGLGATVWLP